jgi:hypothetical protein
MGKDESTDDEGAKFDQFLADIPTMAELTAISTKDLRLRLCEAIKDAKRKEDIGTLAFLARWLALESPRDVLFNFALMVKTCRWYSPFDLDDDAPHSAASNGESDRDETE